MKVFVRFPTAAAILLAIPLLTATLPPRLYAQQAERDSSPSASAKNNSADFQESPNETHMPASGEATTRDTKTFTGRIVKEDGKIVLKDPVTKVTYKLDDEAKAKQFLGKQVKVTGKLDTNTNTIQLDHIEPIS